MNDKSWKQAGNPTLAYRIYYQQWFRDSHCFRLALDRKRSTSALKEAPSRSSQSELDLTTSRRTHRSSTFPVQGPAYAVSPRFYNIFSLSDDDRFRSGAFNATGSDLSTPWQREGLQAVSAVEGHPVVLGKIFWYQIYNNDEVPRRFCQFPNWTRLKHKETPYRHSFVWF